MRASASRQRLNPSATGCTPAGQMRFGFCSVIPTASDGPLNTAGAAGRDHVRVVDLEAGALQALDIVDDGALDVRERRAVDEDAQTMVLEHRVAIALRVERQRVLEARASAAAHAHAQAGGLDVG